MMSDQKPIARWLQIAALALPLYTGSITTVVLVHDKLNDIQETVVEEERNKQAHDNSLQLECYKAMDDLYDDLTLNPYRSQESIEMEHQSNAIKCNFNINKVRGHAIEDLIKSRAQGVINDEQTKDSKKKALSE